MNSKASLCIFCCISVILNLSTKEAYNLLTYGQKHVNAILPKFMHVLTQVSEMIYELQPIGLFL